MVEGTSFRFWGLRLGDLGFWGLRLGNLGFRVYGMFRVKGLGLRVWNSGFGVQGEGFRA
jgi:hypothetical protein